MVLLLFRGIESDAPQAISRLCFDCDGQPLLEVDPKTGAEKKKRRFLGPVGRSAIKLDADDTVQGGLFVGEGFETCQTHRQLGLKPCWAFGSAVSVGNFPVLNGVECLTILRERCEVNARAANAVTARWQANGREVFDAWPNFGKDANDALMMGAAA